MNRKNIILGGLLILLIAAAWVYQGPLKKWQSIQGQPGNPLAGIKLNQIDKIEITSYGATTTLEKNGDKWKIGGTKDFFAKTDYTNALISALQTAQKADLEIASENSTKKPEFNTDTISGVNLRLLIGPKVALDIVVGKMTPDYSGCYISSNNDIKTYYLQALLRNYVDLPDWRDDIIFIFDKTKITKIRWQYPNKEFILVKKEDEWSTVAAKPENLAGIKIDEVLTLLSALTAAGIPEQNFTNTGLDKSQIIIQLTGEGIDNTLMIGDESKAEEGMYFAKRGNSDNIYLISADDRKKLDKKIMDLK